VTKPERDRQGAHSPAAHPQRAESGPVPKAIDPSSSASTSRGSHISLTELDTPGFAHSKPPELLDPVSLLETAPTLPPSAANENGVSDVRQLAEPREFAEPLAGDTDDALDVRLLSLTDAAVIPDSDAAALEQASESVLSPKPAPEPNVSTRAHTHVAPEAWLDRTLEIQGAGSSALDTRQRLAWRFKAAFAAWKLLLPQCTTPEARKNLTEAMRRYERLLRSSGPTPRDNARQISDLLHTSLSDAQTVEFERALTELENTLLAADESISNDAFKVRFGREQVEARQLLRYARFLGARRFGVGYRRDRFEALTRDLLTASLPSGKLLLMPRKRAGQVLKQLLRGLYRPKTSAEDQAAGIQYLRDALDRLAGMASAKQFFDSGFFLDVYGYKISMHDRITSPEFLYLCVAVDVEIHNRLQSWAAEGGGATSLPALQLQLRAQQEAAQAVFADFHRPLVGSAPAARPAPSKRAKKRAAARGNGLRTDWLRFGAASVLVLAALGGNLYVTGVLELKKAPAVVPANELQQLWPLLLDGHLTHDGKRFSGMIARPAWQKLTPRERTDQAVRLAALFKERGIEHAEVVAYKSRAIQIDYGTVVYVDGGR